MKLEEKHKLSLKSFEWWFTGLYSPENKTFFTFYISRNVFIDFFSFSFYDLDTNKATVFSKFLKLEKTQEENKLSLNKKARDYEFHYNGSQETNWVFDFTNKDYQIHLEYTPSEQPMFTKLDGDYLHTYEYSGFFHNTATGNFILPNKSVNVKNAVSYTEHYYGIVPRKASWQYIAAQNNDMAISIHRDHLVSGENYCQILFRNQINNSINGRWIRLSQDVCFENAADGKNGIDVPPTKVTSVDMELNIVPYISTYEHFCLPPVIPFLGNLKRYEYFMKISGKVRIDGQWIILSDAFGVLEEDYGNLLLFT